MPIINGYTQSQVFENAADQKFYTGHREFLRSEGRGRFVGWVASLEERPVNEWALPEGYALEVTKERFMELAAIALSDYDNVLFAYQN